MVIAPAPASFDEGSVGGEQKKEERAIMKTWKCTDGFVEKIIQADSAVEAAEAYAIVDCVVKVIEIDDDGHQVGKAETFEITP